MIILKISNKHKQVQLPMDTCTTPVQLMKIQAWWWCILLLLNSTSHYTYNLLRCEVKAHDLIAHTVRTDCLPRPDCSHCPLHQLLWTSAGMMSVKVSLLSYTQLPQYRESTRDYVSTLRKPTDSSTKFVICQRFLWMSDIGLLATPPCTLLDEQQSWNSVRL